MALMTESSFIRWSINPFTAMPLENDDSKPFSLFVSLFASVCERMFIKTHGTERCDTEPGNTLFAGMSVHSQPANCTGWGSEGVNKEPLCSYVSWRFFHFRRLIVGTSPEPVLRNDEDQGRLQPSYLSERCYQIPIRFHTTAGRRECKLTTTS